MVDRYWVKKRLMNTKDSTLEWIGTIFFVGGFLIIVVLFRYIDVTEPSVFRTFIWFLMVLFGAFYSIFFLGSLGSFFPRSEENKTPFEEIESVDFFQRHPRIKGLVGLIIGLIVYLLILQTSIYYLMGLYDLLLFSTQIPDIIVAILVAILSEQIFQLLGIGFKNIIKYQTIDEPQKIQTEEL